MSQPCADGTREGEELLEDSKKKIERTPILKIGFGLSIKYLSILNLLCLEV